ncbi:DegT/DnrJ/EryC1/StrS family aminotransferase [Magnetofaba australis]|uniref:Putative DegT/DnrJ/EryC1/StrS aminotransferase n=1 Tax=Magnetofaba australis IT-1 TaxID=1434232 RepID=A0A1Y2K264_9PROT|nr:DegT/DnrJ/EryC1/StrS family aminotransferase [Magnetofaba australis]OSM02120.1 putative DegT/DnrJ/EryC1/StrS aminotransferase [Magnetofaba australis IT-1]
MSGQNIPLVDLKAQFAQVGEQARAAMDAVLQRGDFVLGQAVREFEAAFADFCGAQHAVGCGNGTDALYLAFAALGLGAGDRVIVPAMTFAATALAVRQTGADVTLVDIDPATGLLDPSKLEAAITPAVKAIAPVHLYGQCADMEAILKIAAAHNLPVVEDAAQAHGATLGDRRAGSMGTLACFSFYPGKNLGAYGDGGMVTTNDAALAERLEQLRNLGSPQKYKHELNGCNSRLDTVQAAVLGVKLPHLDAWNAARREHAAWYDGQLAGLKGATPLTHNAGSVYHLYVTQVDNRDAVLKLLNEAGIGAGIHYPFAIHELGTFADLGYKAGDFPYAEALARHGVSLPIYAELTEAQRRRVITVLAEALESV